VTTDTTPLVTRFVELETADGPMSCYEAVPAAGASGRGAIVIQEAFGVNDHIQDVTRRLAAEGYHALAPSVFHRTAGATSFSYDRFDPVKEHMVAMTDDGILQDVDAVRRHLEEAGLGDDRTGIIGFCMGGRVSFLVAARRRLAAAVGFYGGGIVKTRFGPTPALIGEIPTMATPWLGLFGDLDTGIPVEDVEELRSLLERDATVDWDIVRYPDAGHGFNCDQRPLYHEPSARDAWRRALQWFDAHLP